MIEMPLNRVPQGGTPPAASSDTPADAPQGAFEEMLSRSLGHRLVGRHAGNGRHSNQDAAQGETQFYQGMVVTSWTPQSIDELLPIEDLEAVPGVASDIPAAAVPVPAPAAAAPATAPAVAAALEAAPIAATPMSASAASAETARGQTPPTVARAAATAVQPPVDVEGRSSVAARVSTPAAARGAHPDVPLQPMPTAPKAVASLTAPPSQLVPPPRTEAPGPTPTAMPQATNPPIAPQPADTGNVMVAAAPTLTARRRPLEQSAQRATDPAPSATVATAGSTTGVTAGAPAPASPIPTSQHAALVNRVLQMVEHQQTQPPPRMVVVDMPELEGLRLMVALQADGKVHVAPIAGSAPTHVADSFVTAVGEALAADGFNLADGRDNGRRDRRDVDEPAPAPQPRHRRTRRARRSSGLRL